MQEQLVSFETAKLLKEKGFDVECRTYFDEKKFKQKPVKFFGELNANALTVWSDKLKKNISANLISCPTQSLAQKWLREIHHIMIQIDFNSIPLTEKEYGYGVFILSNINDIDETKWEWHVLDITDIWYKSYDEALEVGIVEALKIIQ